MADYQKRVSKNVDGEFFVDSTCIYCDTCRHLAPSVFKASDDAYFVATQPQGEDASRASLYALLACPTGSIGTVHANLSSEAQRDFPLPIAENVFYCGFNSHESLGGNSYFIRDPEGNWLIDSPKYLPHLTRKFEEAGGIQSIFLTHQEHAVEAAKYAEKFGSRRIAHEKDMGPRPDAEVLVEGTRVVELEPGFKIIPTPGHTEGHCVLLYKDKFLFTGDHLWWRTKQNRPGTSQSVASFSWPKQIESMARLLDFDFEWILPGHGSWARLPKEEMKKELKQLVERMKASLEVDWE